jgi:hypothetical protein
MAADTSAYAVLGLEPGAAAAEVERAYKKLIKQYHPDREGGDAERAAEINRAYRDLRRERNDLVFNDDDAFEASSEIPWASAAAVIAVGIILLVLFTGPVGRALGQLSGGAASTRQVGGAEPAPDAPDIMNQPLDLAAVNGAVGDAVRISRGQDEMALASASRDCHHQLRLKPALAKLDRCAAFDDAVVQLQDRDPLRDQGPFSEFAVTGRLMSAATLFSDDYLAIDSRLDRIRLRVELALAPRAPEPVPAERDDQR